MSESVAGRRAPALDESRSSPSRSALKTIGVQLLLLCALPFNFAVTAVALVRSWVIPSPRARPVESRTVLISGGKMTKALHLARAFHRAGHRVVLVETRKYRFTGHRFSRAVDRFHSVPEPQDDGYSEALLRIVQSEGVDVYVPVCSPLASRYDARAEPLLEDYCEVVHVDTEMIERLDDKYEFSQFATSLGLPVPRSHRITSAEQVTAFDFETDGGTYILKSIPYDPVHRLDLTRLPCPTAAETAAFVEQLPISPEKPWIMQAFVEGQEYCTHTTVRDGEVQLHCCCASSAFQINYEMIDKPEIEAWVRRFVGAAGLTGQVSFDFIETAEGELYAIECNPRTHSAITMFYDHPDVARAYLERGPGPVTPMASSRPTYWLYHEIWRLLARPTSISTRWRTVRRGKEAIFDWSDPLPFLMVHHLQIPWLLTGNLVRGKSWIRVDFNIGKLVEPAGD